MKLPNGSLAIVDIRKIRNYCLNLDHPSGKHKARVFASAFRNYEMRSLLGRKSTKQLLQNLINMDNDTG